LKSGVLNLYKEKGYTSHDAVCRIRKLFGTKKVGHTGTLDPQATGVLPILIGGAVKACDLIPKEEKVYLATLRFGISTDTQDIWGTVLKEDAARPSREELEQAIPSFLGEYHQVPPMVSAVKINGKKLYEYAREGITVERPARLVWVHRLELISFDGEEATLRASVSKGTYIRTLLVDLCEKMGVLGAMSSLEREKSGAFAVTDALSLKELETMSSEERERALVPVEAVFDAHPIVFLPDFFDRLIRNGCAVKAEKLKLETATLGQRFRLYEKGKFVALGEVVSTEDGLCLKQIKVFPEEE
jgi:tRNA pseudouridine55 synthase